MAQSPSSVVYIRHLGVCAIYSQSTVPKRSIRRRNFKSWDPAEPCSMTEIVAKYNHDEPLSHIFQYRLQYTNLSPWHMPSDSLTHCSCPVLGHWMTTSQSRPIPWKAWSSGRPRPHPTPDQSATDRVRLTDRCLVPPSFGGKNARNFRWKAPCPASSPLRGWKALSFLKEVRFLSCKGNFRFQKQRPLCLPERFLSGAGMALLRCLE